MSNKPQYIYDDPEFFAGYLSTRGRPDSLNILIEQPEIKKLLPDVKGKRVLDLGCGYGDNCSEFARGGAKRVVGVDLSEKMLEIARSENCDKRIEFLRMDISDIDRLDGKFDLIFSALVFHYVEDFESLVKKLYDILDEGGVLLFSQFHPLHTAGGDGFNLDEDGKAVSYNLRDYARTGIRRIKWIVDDVEIYHRDFAEIVNPLADAGFIVERIIEPTPSKEAITMQPKLARHFIRPCFLIVKARKS